MIRTFLLAFATPFLLALFAAVVVAEEPTADLENIALQIMTQAIILDDCETVETLFDKLSLENKKMFLQAVATIPLTQSTQTQLLGRLTLSLFEPSKTEKTQVVTCEPCEPACCAPAGTVQTLTRGNEIDIRVNEQELVPVVFVNIPHVENIQKINGNYTIDPDGYITFGYGGRAYVDGLTVEECQKAIEFHFSKYKYTSVPQPQPMAPFQVHQMCEEARLATIEDAWMMPMPAPYQMMRW